jgi:hypothetical protein
MAETNRIYFTGVGEAHHIDVKLERAFCPRIGETVTVPVAAPAPDYPDETEEWTVRHISHVITLDADYDVYCVIGPAPPRY